MISKKNIALITLALMASVSKAFAQTLLFQDDFTDGETEISILAPDSMKMFRLRR
jgi:hypothetical protein